MTWKVGPALACGNTVVVKPSEETPSTATLLGEVMNKVGVPKGVYNVVHGFGPNSAGEFLTRHPGIAAITFTGETRTGTAIMKAAAEAHARRVDGARAARTRALVFADADFRRGSRRHRSCELRQHRADLPRHRARATSSGKIFDKFVTGAREEGRSMKIGAPGGPEARCSVR